MFGKANRYAMPGLLALASATPSLASGGDLLPAVQLVGGYSLATAAQATAVYNTGIQSSNPNTPTAPSLPFDVLVGNTSEAAKYIYLSSRF